MNERMKGIRADGRLRAVVPVLAIAFALVAAFSVTSPSSARAGVLLAYVDMVDDESMVLEMVGWGPPQPGTSGGDWGNYDALGASEQARVVWYDQFEGVPDPNGADATLTVAFGGSVRMIEFYHLDGLGDDSFKLYVPGAEGWVEVFSYVDEVPQVDSPECWHLEQIDMTSYYDGICDVYLGASNLVLRFSATGPAWGGWSVYGQLAIDHICLYGNGVVATLPADWGEWTAVANVYEPEP
ncbi:MAG: hypothetical protein AB1793_01005 [Candidatus Thermoplasmatota archaeon]